MNTTILDSRLRENDDENNLLTLKNVRVNLGAKTFGAFNLSIKANERIAVLGASGAGKSTLLKLLSNELQANSGEITLNGRHLKDWSLIDLSFHRAVLPQSHEVAFGLPTRLVIGLGRVAKMIDPHLEKIIELAADLACASHLLESRFDALSGGEKARIQLARVFAQLWDVERGLLLVDEPLAALDPRLQLDLLDAIQTFAAQRKHAVLAILHDINHALQHFDRLILIKNGEIAGDLPSSFDAISKLEDLYGVQLLTAKSENGSFLVMPISKRRNVSTQ